MASHARFVVLIATTGRLRRKPRLAGVVIRPGIGHPSAGTGRALDVRVSTTSRQTPSDGWAALG